MTETTDSQTTGTAPEWLIPNDAPASGASHSTSEAVPSSDSGIGAGDLIQTSITLIALIGAILVAAWLVKRFGGMRQDPGQTMRIVASRSLGQRERIVVVDVDDHRLVLGVTAHNVRTLDKLDAPPESDTADRTATPPSFGQALAAQLRGKRVGFGLRRRD